MSWKRDSLNRLFNPGAVAVIGASEKPEKLGALSLLALSTFEGKVYPINPKHEQLAGKKCYKSVEETPKQVDLALVAVGPQQVLDAVTSCADAGVGGAVVFSAGFKELGGVGIEHQKRLKEVANAGRVAVIGPNCLGAGNLDIGLNATFFPHPVEMGNGNVALVS
ncbi:hypothetical protein EU546_05190, partial [Candidatus Thorarchaeota archaeon]